MSSCADVFIELLSTKNKLLSADTWMMWMEHTKDGKQNRLQTFYIFQLFTHRRLNLSALVSKNADQPWDVELTDDSNRAEQSRKRRRRFKKRNIAEKVNGTCKQDFTCRNGLIAVPTVNKDFSCCETTQQKIQVPGVDREMCLKKEFYYCDSTLQKQGLSCSEGKEEDFKKESLLQLRPITRFQLQRCCRDVLTACDRKEIQQLCLDSSHECSLLLDASSDNKAPLWKQHNKKKGA
ncbi:hypothetical protein DPMN_173711 [Dreissena polymorpha]|uniref:Uncharacterized protein n=1 Tax=Dreissena polymorpha TaxID=45954 RepID=A0A9D4E236_DREPO|nr:hypothetical protein DPMN_173711 [Dreissena polymorpha]